MLSSKEFGIITIISFIFALTLSMLNSLSSFFYALIFIFIIIMVNLFAKKIAAFYFDSEIKIQLWTISRISFKPNKEFKNSFPAGLFFPVIFTGLSFGYFTWLGSLIFKTKSKIYRAAKRHGIYSFSEMPEYHIGLIAAAGILANILFAIIGHLIGYPEFARLNFYYAFFNLIPISNLDGNKIFFGSKILWSFLTLVVLLGLII